VHLLLWDRGRGEQVATHLPDILGHLNSTGLFTRTVWSKSSSFFSSKIWICPEFCLWDLKHLLSLEFSKWYPLPLLLISVVQVWLKILVVWIRIKEVKKN
jgi:hypothetical protein